MQVLADSIVDKVEEIVTDAPELPDDMLPETAVETALGPEPFQDSIVAAEYSLPLEMDSVDYEQQWHEFWNPFRSEIAARGFVSQLEKVTGLDYRIVKIKAGVYQVGFAYQDDNERLAKISQITAATGLEFPEL